MTTFRIKNQTRRMVILRLNNGNSLFLEPGTLSGKIPGEELENNPMVAKLGEQGIITVEKGHSKEPDAAGKKKTKKSKKEVNDA